MSNSVKKNIFKFPILYHVWLEINNFYFRGYLYNCIKIHLFKTDTESEVYSEIEYENMIEGYELNDKESKYAESLLLEVFSKKEIDVMQSYFKSEKDTILKYKKVKLPFSKKQVLSMEVFSQNCDLGMIFDYSKSKNYPFNFEIQGLCWYPEGNPVSIEAREAFKRVKLVLKEAKGVERTKVLKSLHKYLNRETNY